MRKVFLILLNKNIFFVFVMTFSLMSCEREETISSNDGLAFRHKSNYMIYYDNGNPNGTWGKDFGCRDTGGNCIEPILITNYIKVFSYALASRISTGTPTEIREYFTVNRTLLDTLLDYSLVEDVIDGKIFVKHRGGIDEGSFALIFMDENNVNQAVQPFVL